jgi:peptidoglycan/xylan/chitin deacetylase (PgdA/CDA1 family)
MKLRDAVLVLFLILSSNIVFCQQRVVALTFDDGPNPKFLEKALPYFESQDIQVTFFVIGGQVKQYPELIAKESEAGHEIENHTFGHVCLVKPGPKWTGCREITLEGAIQQLTMTNNLVRLITGYSPVYVRPPYFAMTKERVDEIYSILGMKVIEHGADSIGSLDWVYNSPEKIVAQVKKVVTGRGMKSCIIVFHETVPTFEALPQIVDFFKDNGYIFVRLFKFEQMKKRGGLK